MPTFIYSVCAVVGGTVLVCQFVMTMLGLGDVDLLDDVPSDGPDLPHGHGGDAAHAHGSWLFGVLTFRTFIGALTFFGLAGLAGGSSNWPNELTLVVALAAGAASMYGIHWMMQSIHKLRSEGTVRIDRAVGKIGTVYLRIPPGKSGAGKVHVNVQNRTMEYEALTAAEEELPFGARVMVTNVIGPQTVEVQHIEIAERVSHA